MQNVEASGSGSDKPHMAMMSCRSCILSYFMNCHCTICYASIVWNVLQATYKGHLCILSCQGTISMAAFKDEALWMQTDEAVCFCQWPSLYRTRPRSFSAMMLLSKEAMTMPPDCKLCLSASAGFPASIILYKYRTCSGRRGCGFTGSKIF